VKLLLMQTLHTGKTLDARDLLVWYAHCLVPILLAFGKAQACESSSLGQQVWSVAGPCH